MTDEVKNVAEEVLLDNTTEPRLPLLKLKNGNPAFLK